MDALRRPRPGAARRGQATLAPPPDLAAFDALVVRVVYRLSRMFEHSPALSADMVRGLEAGGMTLGAAVSLIRL